MKKGLWMALALAFGSASATVDSDRRAFVNYYKSLFPGVEFADYTNGVYAIDAGSREQFEDIVDGIAPYEVAIDQGAEEFEKYGLGNCPEFRDLSTARINYPYFDEATQQVVTLEGDIMKCYKAQTGKKLASKKGKIARLSAYISDQAEGQKINVKVDSPGAIAAYEKGKNFYYAKRGQLNLACADCHVYSAGKKIRADILSPALGHTTHVPMYRARWGEMGTLHRRFGGCNSQVRAKAFSAQSEEYRNLEYFMAAMNNGLEITTERYRK